MADLDSMKTQIQAVGVLALMLGAALAFVMRRNIVAPIRRLTGVARRVGSGDLDARAPIESRDEIGVLARTFNAMTEHLNATLEDLERRRREQQTSAETLAALHETTLGLISRLQLSDLLEALVERAGHLLGTPHGYIYLQDESAFEIQRRIGVGVFSDSMGFPLKPGEGVAGRVWSSGEPLVVNDYASWEGRPDSTSYDVDVRSIIGVPLNSRGRTVGVLGMAYDADSGQAFSTAEVKILDRFAQLASLSLDNAYLYEEVRVARDEAQQALEQLRLAQESLLHSEKLASLGQLTAGIAHEIKNPLNFVNNFAEVSGELLAELNDTIGPALTAMPADVRDEAEDLLQTLSGNLGKINEHGARADSIVKGMLSHAREGEDVARAADLNALLEESLNLAYHGARAENADFNVTLETELSDAVGEVEIHPQEVMRVFLNLIGNGFHATHKRRLAGDEPDYAPTLKLSSHDRGDEVEVRVRDNGTGMPREVAERVFEPFFTTKPPGQGTGLGLSISYDIVTKQHHGRLEVHSKAGEYTEFRVTFPRHVGGASGAQ